MWTIDVHLPPEQHARLERAASEEVIRNAVAKNEDIDVAVLASVTAGEGAEHERASILARACELGIRTALGASRHATLVRELGHALRLAILGIGIGVPLALAGGRLIRTQLFGISASDPLTLAAVACVVLLITGVASYLPARRATAIDPLIALRSD